MRIKQTYRYEGTSADGGRGDDTHLFLRDKKGPAQSLTLTARQFERLGQPRRLEVVIRVADDS